ncbi:teichoic acid D-Ala incorporation-associated protein DltX [Paenibacillus filicis]|uniref:Teichoic acid D-Ala incorporation-associated protein DltX n=1 Tax=Paenibacillus gyeongsangnamensis TaxID=3388067 RepID=A0ABT4Q854_9BACL|nr:teichoic acid D-Ala incorporation-associated protein DltX [Paenibacillus filicis]MCZ8513049.1 teichoic acid D-Ala incorporation-associated protein DltX [Paenibacillus filicis]
MYSRLTRFFQYAITLWIWKTIYYIAILVGLLWIYGIHSEQPEPSGGTFIYNGF